MRNPYSQALYGTIGFTLFWLQNVEKPMVLQATGNGLWATNLGAGFALLACIKDPTIGLIVCFRSKMSTNSWFFNGFAQQC